jgi:flagellar hook-associated protein 1 FlgK
MSDLLSIGASGVRAYQTALSTTSDNIANAGTTGYSRRTTTMKEVGRATSVALGQTTLLVGNGVYASGIARSSDSFRAAEVRRTGSDLARTETGAAWLDRIEGALTGNRLGDRLTTFFNAAKAVAADPAAGAPRSVLLESAASLAAAFGGTGRALAGAAEDLKGTGRDAALQLNGLADSLLRVNRGLARADEGSSGRAQLLDERDRLLEGMAALTDISVATDIHGRVEVRAGGPAGPVLADGDATGIVTFAINDSGATSFTVHRDGASAVIASNGGVLAGIADSATRIAGARETLDTLARDFAEDINALQAGGRDLDGAAGAPMFTIGDPASELTLVLDAPRGIAAAAVGEGTRGNGNLAALAALRTNGGYEVGLDDLVTTNAAALSAKVSVAEAQGAIHGTALSARDSVSGVDLDEEAVDLMRFQQAYQASSRVIQIARETFDTIFANR